MDMPYVGPYRVAEKLERDRYRLRDRHGSVRHSIFSVKRLKLYPKGGEGSLEPDDDYYRVSHIVDRRYSKDKRKHEYRLRWVCYATMYQGRPKTARMRVVTAFGPNKYIYTAVFAQELVPVIYEDVERF